MALSFKEKRELQKIVASKMADLKSGTLAFKEKRTAQKELKAAFDRLKAKIELGGESEALQDLLAGKFNDLDPIKFLVKLKEIVTEIEDLEPTKPGISLYMSKNQDKMVADVITESALLDSGVIAERAKPEEKSKKEKEDK